MDLVDKKEIYGKIDMIVENLENSTLESIQGENWKSIIPSEEEIRSALYKETD